MASTATAAASSLPRAFRRLVVTTLGSNFRSVTKIESQQTEQVLQSMKPSQVLVKNLFSGVNASDVNFSAGRYLPGAEPPLYPGFEAVGEVVHCGPDVQHIKEGDAVAHTGYGTYSEYQVVSAARLIPLPDANPAFIPLMVSGLTASISLEEVGDMTTGETVLVTAAAGSTGQYAVQLAKLAGNHVIGTCSSDEKAAHLRKLGCDRVVNYKKESLHTVLKEEYPKGLDLVYECVGGDMFNTAVNHLAVKGRLVVIGFISGYQDQSGWTGTGPASGTKGSPLPVKLLAKSASIRGFFLNNYAAEWAPHLQKLGSLLAEGKLHAGVDMDAKFTGLEQVADAIDYMYAGKNVGKVLVALHPQTKL